MSVVLELNQQGEAWGSLNTSRYIRFAQYDKTPLPQSVIARNVMTKHPRAVIIQNIVNHKEFLRPFFEGLRTIIQNNFSLRWLSPQGK